MKQLLVGFGLAASVILLIGAAASLPRYVGTFVGNGAIVTNLNASSLASGTVANARLPDPLSVGTVIGTTKVSAGEENVVLNENGNITFSGQIFGDGSQLTGIVGGGGGIPGTNTVIAYGNLFRTNSIGISTNGISITGRVQVAGSSISSLVNGNDNVMVMQHDPTISGTIGTNSGHVGGVTFGTIYNSDLWNNGPAWQPSYIDDTWSIGMNVGTLTGSVADTNYPSLVLTWESKYYNGTTFSQEFHIQGVSSNGTAFRPLALFAAHDLSVVRLDLKLDSFTIADNADNPLLQVSDENTAVDVFGLKLRFTSNNVPAIQQKNAAGAMTDVLYLDAGDTANMPHPLYVAGQRAGATAPIPGAFVAFTPTTANSNDSMLYLGGPSVLNTHFGVIARSSASGLFQQEFNNQGAGDSQVYVTVEGAGDPKLKLEVSGGGRFTMGIDNSDSDKFKISTGAALGSGDAVTIDSSGNILLNTNLTVLGQTRVGGVTTFSNSVYFGSENLGGGASANLWFWSEDEVAFQHLRIEDSTFVFEGEVASTGFFGPGINITSLDASALTQGTADPARLGTNAPFSNSWLRATSATTAEWSRDGSGFTNTAGGGGTTFPLTSDTLLWTNNTWGVEKGVVADTDWNSAGLLGLSWYYLATKNSIYMGTNSLHFNTFGGQNMVFDQGLDVTDTVTASFFAGDGSQLTGINAANLFGTLSVTQLNVGTITLTNNPFILKAGDTMLGQLGLPNSGIIFTNGTRLSIESSALNTLRFYANGGYQMQLSDNGLLLNNTVNMQENAILGMGAIYFGENTMSLTPTAGNLALVGGSLTARTNIAQFDVGVSDFVIGTRYTNSIRRSFVTASFQLGAAAAGTAAVSLRCEQSGVTNRVNISAGPLASLSTVEQLSLMVGPGAFYYFVDDTSGTGASVSIVAGTSSRTDW